MSDSESAGGDAFVERILHGGDRSLPASLLRGLLTPFSALHRLWLEIYLLPYAGGLRKRYRIVRADGDHAPVPVIAIGNVSSGGTGKTPMAQLVAGHLHSAGKRVVLLSRGHGGSGEVGSASRIVSDRSAVLLGPDDAGDEPILLARSLPGVPVIVGRDRRRSGRLAVETFAPDVIVLDDALQYWQLHRDLDIVLLDARRPFDNGYLLPRGLLREPPSHLARAGVVVLTRADRVPADALAQTLDRVRRLAPRAALFTATHAPVGWTRASDNALLPLDALAGSRVALFSGIADNDAFRNTVEALGARVVSARPFRDHHRYVPDDIADLATGHDAEAVVTTEKDLVKAAGIYPAIGLPFYALRIGMKVSDESSFFARLDRIAVQ